MLQLFQAAMALTLATSPTSAAAAEVVVDRTNLKVSTDMGEQLTGEALKGVEIVVADETGTLVRIRVDGAKQDPWDNTRWLYALSSQNAATGEWSNFCSKDPNGLALGFPLAGISTPNAGFEPSDTKITFTCTSGALSKCIRFGYSPWGEADDGTPLLNHFLACTRMVRADYCGDGSANTRDGTIINVFDRVGIQSRDEVPGFTFEAAWSADGAVCVAHTRWEHDFSIKDLIAACGDKLEDRIGSACTPENTHSMPGAVLFNESLGP